jgi:hypothetical protein
MRKPNKFAHMADGTVIVMLERRDRTVLACRIDAADWVNVRGHRWYAHKDRNTFYAHTDGKRTALMHRLLLPDAVEVDHKDRNGLNNQRANLRPATSSQNAANRRKRKVAVTSQYKGVDWYRRTGKYYARIMVNGKQHYLGSFTNQEDAARAYNAAAVEHFGKFAKLNDIQPARLWREAA